MLLYLSFLFNISTAWADEDLEDIRIFVKGMVCSFCVQGVEKQFKKQDAIEKVEVDLEDSLVSIWLKEGQKISDAKIDSLIKDSGYNVESIERLSEPVEDPVEIPEDNKKSDPKKKDVSPNPNVPKKESK